jgi:glycosyltransferase involved in cell wall biosynthesis
MKICLVTAFPPSGRQLNEYGFHLAQELQRNQIVDLTILADKLTNYEWSTDQDGKVLGTEQSELSDFDVLRCWEFDSMSTPKNLALAIHRLRPDVVWFNLVYSSFATAKHPIAAFAGLCTPALTRSMGYFTHVTLHHILENVDFAGAGVKQERLFRLGGEIATRALLRANSVSVLLSGYRRTLVAKYAAENVLLGTHGTFAACPVPPDFSLRGNPDQRILAIGHWGTYKRLETLMEAFPAVLQRLPNARLIVAGANHHTKPGYWESIRETYGWNPRIEFLGYVPEEEVPDLFRSTSVVVLPYDSATGSSGPAHQACEYGVPLVSADLPDFRDMAAGENMAISFYKTGDAPGLAGRLIALLESPVAQQRASEQNYTAALRMTMPQVVRHYLRWFELERRKKALGISPRSLFSNPQRPHSFRTALHGLPPAVTPDRDSRASLLAEEETTASIGAEGSGTSDRSLPGL